MNRPLISWRADGSAADLRFPFDAFVVAEIKRAVPSPLRTYDPATRTWTVAARYVGDIYHLLDQAFGGVDIEGSRTGTSDHRQRAGGDPYRVLHLLPSAPDEVVTVVYRTLARLTHPDVGGDHDAMLALNQAYDAIGGRR
jgi:hypothetical protein